MNTTLFIDPYVDILPTFRLGCAFLSDKANILT